MVFKAANPIAATENKGKVTPDTPVSSEDKTADVVSPSDVSNETGVTPLLSDKPYIAKHYNVKEVWGELSDDIQDAGEVVMDYFKDKVKSEEYSDDTESFKEVMRKLERITNTKHSPLKSKLTQMSNFIKSINRMKRIH